jgi:arsenite-transporting ATPase
MDDLEVEAVESIDEAAVGVADAPEYVLYGGKGGVGKTTMAAATGLASARDGVATLVVSTDPAHSLSDTLETDVPADPARLREDVPLYGAEIDPDDALSEAELFGADGSVDAGGLGDLLGAGAGVGAEGAEGPADEGAAGDATSEGGLGDLLGGPMPGADEAAAMQQLTRFLDDERFERVVVDTAPTGHTLRLLELPEAMDSLLGRMTQARERVRGMLGSLPGMEGSSGPDLDAARERIERLRAVLRDPERTDFRVVMVPEEMSVVESERLVRRLDAFGVPVGTVVVNRVMEDFADAAGVDSGDLPDGDDPFVSPDLENCAFCRRRWEVQQGALREATDLFRGREVKRVPLFADEVRGERMLRVVGACLS